MIQSKYKWQFAAKNYFLIENILDLLNDTFM